MKTFLLLLLFPCLTYAAECSDTSQAGMTQCSLDEYGESLSVMNEKYALAKMCLSKGDLSLMEESQLDWAHLARSFCENEYIDDRGGSVYTQLFYGCLVEEVKARVTVIQTLLNDCKHNYDK